MKKLAIIFLLFTITSIFAQAKPYLDYHKGTKIIKRRGFVLNNTFHKEWKYFTKEGKLEAIGNWDNGKKHGEWKFFDENGKISMRGSYGKNLKTGEWKYYSDGVLFEKENFIDDNKNGEFVKYYEGKLLAKGNFKNDRQFGKWVIFYVEGKNEGKPRVELNLTEDSTAKQLMTKYYYNEDYKFSYYFLDPYYAIVSVKIEEDEEGLDIPYFMDLDYHGKYEGYYKDGKLFCNGEYLNNEQNGIWTYFHENGKIWAEGELKDSEYVGVWKGYHQNGELASLGEYDHNGNEIGKWQWWHDNKQLSNEIMYVKSQIPKCLTIVD